RATRLCLALSESTRMEHVAANVRRLKLKGLWARKIIAQGKRSAALGQRVKSNSSPERATQSLVVVLREVLTKQQQTDRQDFFGEIVATRTVMKLSRLRNVVVLIVVLVACPMARAGGERKSWKTNDARESMDARRNGWM